MGKENATPEEHRKALIQGTAMLIQLQREIEEEKGKKGKGKKGGDGETDLPMLPPAPEGTT